MNPIDGQPLLAAAAKASVGPELLPKLVEHVQSTLGSRLAAYRRDYERALEGDRYEAFFVEEGHWETLGEELDLDRREREAVARAHREQVLFASRRADRREEIETSLEVREVVVVGR